MNSELQNCQQTEPCTVEEIRNSLEQSEKGKVYNTAANYKRVLQYDPLLKGAIHLHFIIELPYSAEPWASHEAALHI